MKKIMEEQSARYPGMEAQDMVKLLYQSEFGGGHLIGDQEASFRRLKEEWASVQREAVSPGSGGKNPLLPAVEPIGGGYCRVDLGCLPEGLSMETLHRLFVLSAGLAQGNRDAFEKKLALLAQCSRDGSVGFDSEKLESYLKSYREQGYPLVSHSERYRKLYRPAYRVVAESYARYLNVFADIDRALAGKEGSPVSVAIDGQCAAGKTTLAQSIFQVYDCNVFHMDDFFLRPEQRTAARLEQIGGNVDYERFLAEVLEPLKKNQPFRYRTYNCALQQLDREIEAPVKRLNIVEGSYSRHPYFGDYYDLGYCFTVEKEEQKRRIAERSGQAMLKRFVEEWIPMENAYLEKTKLLENAGFAGPAGG